MSPRRPSPSIRSAAVPDRSGSETASAACSPVGHTAVLAWLAAVAGLGFLQPILLGFYLDDWSLMGRESAVYGRFSRELWNNIVALDPTRPASIVFRWISCSVLRDVPGLWHAFLVASNVVIVFQLAALVRMLAPTGIPVRQAVALPLAAAWMTLPWTSAIRYWPTLLNLHVYFIVFLWLMLYLLRHWRAGKGPVLAPFAAYLAVCLGYEALYLQFAVIAGAALAEVRYRAVSRTAAARSLAALAVAQICAIGWNWYSRVLFPSSRSVYPDWVPLFWWNLRQAIPQMFGSFGEARWLAAAAFMILAAGVAVSIRQALRKGTLQRADLASAALILLALLTGALISAVVFSVGARPFSGFGVEARGLSVISLWSAAAMALTLGMALAYADTVARRILAVGLSLAAAALLAGQMMQFRDWHHAARLQDRVLSLVPVAEILKAEPEARVLCLFPSEVRGAPVFSSPWDVNSAFHITYPPLSRYHFLVYSPWGGALRWDGSKLWSEAIPEKAQPVDVLYLWRPFYGEFLKVERPIIVHQNLEWQYTQ